MIAAILAAFGLQGEFTSSQLKQGLIHDTWKITVGNSNYILQQVNQGVFKNPGDIAHNIILISDFIREEYPGYFFAPPVKTTAGEILFKQAGNCYRMFPFVTGSHSLDTVETIGQAYEAARQFGKFTATLKDFDCAKLYATIPSFHDLGNRYRQFCDALLQGNKHRIAGAAVLISKLQGLSGIVQTYEHIKQNPDFKTRVTHHDTKISNVLLDEKDKGICVIDLDTVMPGYFISDVGDMMRTYLCPVSEEEQDYSKIYIRKEIYHAIVAGYMHEMEKELTDTEKQYFFYAGTFMIYMQALRFMTDHFNNDQYYGAAYPGHNLSRATNQLTLLEKLLELEPALGQAAPPV